MSGPVGHLSSDRRIHEIAVEASPHGVAVVDEAGTIVYANPQLAAIFGYGKEALLGASVHKVVPGALSSREIGRERRRASGRQGAAREILGRRRDGSDVPIEIGLTAAQGDGPRLVVVSVVDISERKRLESDAKEAAERRLEFERLVSDLAVRFVHSDPGEVDDAITYSLRQIGEVLGIDRCTLWQFTETGDDLVHTHLWSRVEPVPAGAVSAREHFPWFLSKVRENESVWCDRVDQIPSAFDREGMRRFGTKSNAVVPMSAGDRVLGALSFGATRTERTWDVAVLDRLRLVAAVFAQGLARRQSQVQLEGALAEVQKLRDQLTSENVQLRHEVKSLKVPRSIASESPAIRTVLAQVTSVAPTDATVLLLGETGSGKEEVAQAIHGLSRRRERPMVRVNCAAIPGTLMESELFGRERGAYTGALSRQIGRFEMASGSTIFLDEVGDFPMEAQAKLLRVLQDRTLERLGSARPIKVDVRVIAATNRDLQDAVATRSFREDLYYRLNVFPITVPPLRARPEDIPVLVWAFIDEFSKAFGKQIQSIARESLASLQRHSWPGNVRELRNVIERAVIVSQGPTLVVDPPHAPPQPRSEATNLADVEAEHIRDVLNRVGWRIRGRGGAAELLGMKPTTLDSRMAKLGIRRPRY